MVPVVFVEPTLAPDIAMMVMKQAWSGFAPNLRMVGLPLWGIRSIRGNFAAAKHHLLEHTSHGPAVIAGWSQGALLAAMFALQYPERVARLVLLAPPWAGAAVSPFFPFVPIAADLRSGSFWLQEFAQSIQAWPAQLVDVHVFAAADDLVVPLSSALTPVGTGTHYYVFGHSRPSLCDQLPAGRSEFHQATLVDHLNIGLHPQVLPHIKRVVLAATDRGQVPPTRLSA